MVDVRQKAEDDMRQCLIIMTALAVLALMGQACSSPEPVPIDYGAAQCESCRMTISDTRFGAELVTKTGKTYTFDSPECLFGWYLAEGQVRKADVHSLWVTDHGQPTTLIDATSALYLKSEELDSPMGMNVAAFATDQDLRAAATRYGGEQIDYSAVLSLSEGYK